MNEERRREIRRAEIRAALAEVYEVFGVDGLPEGRESWLIGVLANYAAQTRKRWEKRDADARLAALIAKYEAELVAESSREAKVQRLIDHPATPEPEREAARRALVALVRRASLLSCKE